MKHEQVAIQLYTLRDFCKTAVDLDRACARVREIGYRAVEIAGTGPIPEKETARILSDNGLVCCSVHEDADTIRRLPGLVVERLAVLGSRYAVYPYPRGVDFSDAAALESLCADLDASGAALAAAGRVLAYHNHSHEFFKLGSQPVLDFIFERTRSETLQAELDTYWVQYGGGNPVAWVEKLAGRLPLLHIKDHAVDATGVPCDAEIGKGTLDFRSILAAAEKSGCEWFIVEQDNCKGDPFDAIRTSLNFIRKEFLS